MPLHQHGATAVKFTASKALGMRWDTPTEGPTGLPTQEPIKQPAPKGEVVPFGKDDAASKVLAHAAGMQDTLVDAGGNTAVAAVTWPKVEGGALRGQHGTDGDRGDLRRGPR